MALHRCGVNLLRISGRTTHPAESSDPAAPKKLDGNGVLIGISSSGYIAKPTVKFYEIARDHVTVEIEPSRNGYGVGFDIPIRGGMEYTASVKTDKDTHDRIGVSYYGRDGKLLDRRDSAAASVLVTGAPQQAAWMVLVLRPHSMAGRVTYTEISVTAGGQAVPFAPYQGDAYTVDFGRRVQAGTYNWTTGVLTVDGPAPETVQLTPAAIPGLSGSNHIYADSGEVTVEGFCRADLPLAGRIQALEEAILKWGGGV